MPRGAIVLIVAPLLLAAGAPRAHAQVKQIFASGQWSAYGGATVGNRRVCGIEAAGPDGGRVMIEQETGQTGLNLILQKGSWSIPGNTAIELSFLFDGRIRFPARATGAGNVVTAAMTFQQTVPFMRAVRQDGKMVISFPSRNEPSWSIGLLGSGAVLNAFDDCRTGLASSTPTQPFTPAPTTTSPATSNPPPVSPATPASAPPAGASTGPTQPTQTSP